jgi:hypothetical protein
MTMFALHSLGWNSFQHLCLTITREVLGQTVGSFLDSADGGRDGAFVGSWKPKGRAQLSGQFVVQCKFTARPGLRHAPSEGELAPLKVHTPASRPQTA